MKQEILPPAIIRIQESHIPGTMWHMVQAVRDEQVEAARDEHVGAVRDGRVEAVQDEKAGA
jgi:hypothetical protein